MMGSYDWIESMSLLLIPGRATLRSPRTCAAPCRCLPCERPSWLVERACRCEGRQRWTRVVIRIVLLLALAVAPSPGLTEDAARLGVFDVDVSPPLGSPLAYDSCRAVVAPLRAKGVVLISGETTVVMCAVDWIGIGNDGHRRFREAVAEAAGTTANRVVIHTLHQHDAPRCDFSVEALLAERGLGGRIFDVAFARQVIRRLAEAVRSAARSAQPVTHVGRGQACVEKVASNRRILGGDGKVRVMRYTACADEKVRAEPEGVIDPSLKCISFWSHETVLAVLTYYATHPQSYYRTGKANPDFPGMARQLREFALNGVKHVHFNGAGGNIGAGKYNDGSPKHRHQLTARLAAGMAQAWENSVKRPLSPTEICWEVVPVVLPAAPHLKESTLREALDDAQRPESERIAAAGNLAWLKRCQARDTIDVGCLRLGDIRILHLPGEAVVEYQLAAAGMRPDLFVAVAAYGDYGPGYICLGAHYQQGGYEDSPQASLVDPSVEDVLMSAMARLLRAGQAARETNGRSLRADTSHLTDGGGG